MTDCMFSHHFENFRNFLFISRVNVLAYGASEFLGKTNRANLSCSGKHSFFKCFKYRHCAIGVNNDVQINKMLFDESTEIYFHQYILTKSAIVCVTRTFVYTCYVCNNKYKLHTLLVIDRYKLTIYMRTKENC